MRQNPSQVRIISQIRHGRMSARHEHAVKFIQLLVCNVGELSRVRKRLDDLHLLNQVLFFLVFGLAEEPYRAVAHGVHGRRVALWVGKDGFIAGAQEAKERLAELFEEEARGLVLGAAVLLFDGDVVGRGEDDEDFSVW